MSGYLIFRSIFEPVLASEREARFNVEHCPKVFRSSPSMIKMFEANPNTSCGLRPRLRRDLDHTERQEESAVFTSLLALSNTPISCLLARWRCLVSPFSSLGAGIDYQDTPSSCLSITRGCLDASKAAWRRQVAA